VIFATLGTHHDPFPRLIRALEALPSSELVVQHGYSEAPSGAPRSVKFLPFAEMVEHIRTADAVITHAGVGSILLCLRNGRKPLVVPRLHRHGEHVDDHQVELTRALAERDKVIPVWDVEDLSRLVADAPRPTRPQPPEPGPFFEAVRQALYAA
jgi:UDP-N-acetylglucosamine transferase subunit ALG13